MLKNAIVLTGGIGTGKSTVASFLKMYGYKIIDADEISKKVFEEKKEEIKKLFNTTDRKEIRKIVCKDKEKLTLYKVPKLKMESKVDESLEEFKIRVKDKLREKRDIAEEKLRVKYEKRMDVLKKRLERAIAKLKKEEADVKEKATSTLLSFGMTILDAFLGSKKVKRSTISKAGATLRGA